MIAAAESQPRSRILSGMTAVLRSIGPREKTHPEAFKPRRGGDASRDAVTVGLAGSGQREELRALGMHTRILPAVAARNRCPQLFFPGAYRLENSWNMAAKPYAGTERSSPERPPRSMARFELRVV